MDKIEQRVVIKYLHTKGLTAKQIHDDIEATLRQSAPSYTMVKKSRQLNSNVVERKLKVTLALHILQHQQLKKTSKNMRSDY